MKPAESPPADSTNARAFPRSRYAVFFGIAVIGCAVDLGTKEWAFRSLGAPSREAENIEWVWEGYFGFQTAVNQGALFGMGQGMSAWFAALSVIAAIGIIFWLFFRGAARDLLLTIALGSVLGGIFGNLYDRLGLWHASDAPLDHQHGVRDWVLLQYNGHTWPNFNIADTLLVCGAVMLMLHAIFYREPKPGDEPDKKSLN